MCSITIIENLNKGYLAPLADRKSSDQLYFLILNSPYVVLINNYKSASISLDMLRAQVRHYNGFAYQPNKNIKIRAFKRLSAVLSLNMMNGLVVFIFFKDRSNMQGFLNILKSEGYRGLTYYSMLINGHLVNTSKLLLDPVQSLGSLNSVSLSVYTLNNTYIQFLNQLLYYSLNKSVFIVYAYIKSISTRS